MSILPDMDNPALVLLLGTSISIGIASGVAYETIYRLRKHHIAGDDPPEGDSGSDLQTQLLTQLFLQHQHHDVQHSQQALLDAILDLNRQLSDAYHEVALLKQEIELLRQQNRIHNQIPDTSGR